MKSYTNNTMKIFNIYINKWLAISIITCIALAWATASHAQITAGFELDGNANSVAPNPPDDWDLIFNKNGNAQVTTGVVKDLPSTADDYFVQGSKDLNDVSTWRWSINSTPDKNDILHAAASLYNGTDI